MYSLKNHEVCAMIPDQEKLSETLNQVKNGRVGRVAASKDDANVPNARQLITSAFAGGLIAMIDVSVCISVAALIFSGPLYEHLPTAIMILLISAAVLSLGGALGSGYPGMVTTPRGGSAPVLAAMAAAVATGLVQTGAESDLLATTVAAITLTTLLTGLVLMLLGYFHLGRLVRFFPYPVICGFFASVGYFLLKGGLSLAARQTLQWGQLGHFLQAEVWPLWATALAFGLALYLFGRMVRLWLVMPLALLLGVVGFYGVLLSLGLSLEQATKAGWLPHVIDTQATLPLLSVFHSGVVHWGTVLQQLDYMALAALVCVTLLLLDVSGIEVTVQRDLDPDRELKVAGISNLVAGMFGGYPGVPVAPDTALVHELGGGRRLTGIIHAGLVLLVLLVGTSIVRVLPTFLLGGVVIYLGIGYLMEWGWQKRADLPLSDFLVVLVILVVSVQFGLMAGVAVGLVLAVVLFSVAYGQLQVIKSNVPGSDRGSYVARSLEVRRALNEQGAQIRIICLQGYIFFGTAEQLVQVLREDIMMQAQPPVGYLVLDFTNVQGLDASAAVTFSRLSGWLLQNRLSVAVTACQPAVAERLRGIGFLSVASVPFPCLAFDQLDEGLAWCEEKLLRSLGIREESDPGALNMWLVRMLRDQKSGDVVAGYLERQCFEAGDVLFHEGTPGDSLYLVYSGRAVVVVDRPDGGGEHVVRVYPSGTILGEMVVYTGEPRSASVRIEEKSVLYRMDAQALMRLQREHPREAGYFHAYIVRLLAERLERSNRELQYYF